MKNKKARRPYDLRAVRAWSRGQDLNLRPPGYEKRILPFQPIPTNSFKRTMHRPNRQIKEQGGAIDRTRHAALIVVSTHSAPRSAPKGEPWSEVTHRAASKSITDFGEQSLAGKMKTENKEGSPRAPASGAIRTNRALIRKPVPDNRGKTTAETFLRNWRDSLVKAESERARHEEASSSSTFAEYAELYILHKELSQSVRPVTVKGYRSYLGKIVGTELGSARIGDVTPKLAASWERNLMAEGLSTATLSHIHVFAKQVCTYARRMGDLPANPFDLVEAPKRRAKPVNSLDAAEVARLNRALRGFGPTPLAVGIRIALSTGMLNLGGRYDP